MKLPVIIILFAFLASCKRNTSTYPLPDYTTFLEKEFPYKDIKKPLIFINEDSTNSKTFIFQSKTISRSKNILRPEPLNRLQSLGTITAKANNFTYSVDVIDTNEFYHGIDFYNISTTFSAHGGGPQYAGSSNMNMLIKHQALTIMGKEYYEVLDLQEKGDYSSKDRRVNRILVNTTNGILGYYDIIDKEWFYLKP